jgi:transposase
MSDAREAELLKLLEAQQRRLEEQAEEIKLLRQKLDALARRVFGVKSEKLDENQLLLLLQMSKEPDGPLGGKGSGPEAELAEPPRPNKASSQKPRDRKPRLPDHLPVIEEVIDPEPVKASPQQWRRIGEEVSERLDYEPARFLRRRTVRPKYVRRGELDAVPVIAPLPDSLLERSVVTPGLLAQIVVSKYCDHLPLYRQESIYWSRHEVWLPRQTLAEWVGLAADWLKPIYRQIREDVLEGGYVQIDETPIRYLEPGHGKTKLGYLWTYGVPKEDVVFHWETSRAATCLDNIIPGDFSGTLQSDGYQAYRSFARSRDDAIVLAGCMAHVRRKFFEAQEQAPKVAGWILWQMRNLYTIESELRETRAGPNLRAAIRSSQSRMIMNRLHHTLVALKTSRRFLPRSLMGGAIDYALGQWSTLLVYLDDGRLEIDNNLIENAIRPTAVGKKNWLFIAEAGAGERSAIIYTIIENCRRRGIDPYAYLKDVFTRLPSMTNWQVKEITPKAWAKQRGGSVPAAAA